MHDFPARRDHSIRLESICHKKIATRFVDKKDAILCFDKYFIKDYSIKLLFTENDSAFFVLRMRKKTLLSDNSFHFI